MSIEIEIKAWVDDFDELYKKLKSRYTYVKEYIKDDRYYRGIDSATGEKRAVRIRREGSEYVVTYKERSHQEKVEVNIEKEVKIDNRKEFEYILNALGFKLYVEKLKTGHHFRYNNINLELSHVKSLGDFIELEIIEDEDGNVEEAKERLFSLLNELGISRNRIEDRYYTEMLLNRA